MHDIEPYFKWRKHYIASEDKKSPFYGRAYDEFKFTDKIYNYYIHPQWDNFGSSTLYAKLIFVDYDQGFCFIELLGEWNDCISNDIMFLKREVIDDLIAHDITRFVVFCENVLNFHGSDDSYYEEWYDDVKEEGGWIAFINTQPHVCKEIESHRLQYYVHVGEVYNEVNWRGSEPHYIINHLETLIHNGVKQLQY